MLICVRSLPSLLSLLDASSAAERDSLQCSSEDAPSGSRRKRFPTAADRDLQSICVMLQLRALSFEVELQLTCTACKCSKLLSVRRAGTISCEVRAAAMRRVLQLVLRSFGAFSPCLSSSSPAIAPLTLLRDVHFRCMSELPAHWRRSRGALRLGPDRDPTRRTFARRHLCQHHPRGQAPRLLQSLLGFRAEHCDASDHFTFVVIAADRIRGDVQDQRHQHISRN